MKVLVRRYQIVHRDAEAFEVGASQQFGLAIVAAAHGRLNFLLGHDSLERSNNPDVDVISDSNAFMDRVYAYRIKLVLILQVTDEVSRFRKRFALRMKLPHLRYATRIQVLVDKQGSHRDNLPLRRVA